MDSWKGKLTNHKQVGNISIQLKPTIKKVIVSTLIFSTLTFASVSTAKAKESSLATIYHVYINNDYVGAATNQQVVESLIQEKMDGLKETYGEYEFVVGNEISYIPEQVFRDTSDNDGVIANLEEQLTIEAEAAAVSIDGKQVTYLENEEMALDVIKQLKLKYVSEKDLKLLEERKANNQDLPPLKDGETRLLDVTLSKDVTISDGEVLPEQILSVEDAVKLLQKGTLEEKSYKVKDGDVLGKIAAAHDLKIKQLIDLNPGITEETVLQIGQKINVTVHKPYIEVMVSKEKFKEEEMAFEKEVIEDKSMFKGDTKVKQKGKKGLRAVTYEVTERNGQTIKKEVAAEKILKEPVNDIKIKGTKVVPSRGSGSLAWPTSGGYVSSKQGYRWGSFHKGIDIARPSNYSIKAADNGVVASAGWDGGYGNKIVINHNNGFRTIYAHLSSVNVRPGQTVSKGSSIGVMGSTGNSTGTHLHFEVYLNGKLQNPLSYLK